MKSRTLLLVAIVFIAIACNSNSEKIELASIADESAPMARMAHDGAVHNMKGNEFSTEADRSTGTQKLIRNAHLSIEVENYEESRPLLDSIVKRHKGWISSENLNNYEQRISNLIVIRVPAVSLDQIVDDLQKIAKRIESKSVNSTDVTEEYIDIESRLSNQREVEKKFITLLQRTNSINDILQIESKLAEIRGNIESIEGRLRYLNNRVDYSTVNLNIYQNLDFKYIPEPMESFWERLKTSLHRGWKGFVSFIILVIGLWPLWVLVGISIFAFGKVKSRRKLRNKTKGTSNDSQSS
jgi:hypothetical protein